MGSLAPKALLVWPGAGGGAEHPTLVALEGRLAPFPVGRRVMPRQKAGGKGTDGPAVAIACVRDEVAALCDERGLDPAEVIIGGRSFGGRMCSMAVAEGLGCGGLVLLSYPLHPPGKPDTLRTEHFSAIDVPCLFISGRRDPFGSPDEFAVALAAISAPVSTVWVNGPHNPTDVDAIVAAVGGWLADLGAAVSHSG